MKMKLGDMVGTRRFNNTRKDILIVDWSFPQLPDNSVLAKLHVGIQDTASTWLW